MSGSFDATERYRSVVNRKAHPHAARVWSPRWRDDVLRDLAYRLNPPRQPHLNAPQRAIWRAQRLMLGNNTARKARRETRRRRSSLPT